MLDEQIKKLAEDLDMKEGLTLVDGGCSFSFDGTPVTIQPFETGFQFFATLGELPQEQVELFLAKMLRGNLFFQATNGACTALDESGSKFMLRYAFPTKCQYRDFKEKVEDFLNTIDFWKTEIKNHEQNPLAA